MVKYGQQYTTLSSYPMALTVMTMANILITEMTMIVREDWGGGKHTPPRIGGEIGGVHRRRRRKIK